MIRLTIQRKVFLATFAQALVLVGLLLGLTRWNLEQGFTRYVVETEIASLDRLVTQLQDRYARVGDWGFLEDAGQPWSRAFDAPGRPGRPGPPGMMPAPPEQSRPTDLPSSRAWPGEASLPSDDLPRPEEGALDAHADGASERTLDADRLGRPMPEWATFGEFPPPFPNPRGFGGPPPPAFGGNPPPFGAPARGLAGGLEIGSRLSIRDTAGRVLVGNTRSDGISASRPLRVGGQTVGDLVLSAPATGAAQDAAFLASQTRDLWLSALAALALSIIVAALLARQFLGPIKALARGARRITEGRPSQRIVVRGADELSALAADFNTMADMLERTEEARRGWVADSSHELRTPIAVLRAEIEALQDGVRSADERTLARLLKRVLQMGQLVDDLRQTLDRDRAELELHLIPLEPLELLRETLEDFRPRLVAADLTLDTGGLPEPDPGWRIRGDAERLAQVFGNLIENSLRYTRSGGRLRVAASAAHGRLRLQFDDTPPAPPDKAMGRLFERFFRAEASRSRLYGGAGLGLAICKTLVSDHGGSIAAARSDLGGLCIRIDLPLEC